MGRPIQRGAASHLISAFAQKQPAAKQEPEALLPDSDALRQACRQPRIRPACIYQAMAACQSVHALVSPPSACSALSNHAAIRTQLQHIGRTLCLTFRESHGRFRLPDGLLPFTYDLQIIFGAVLLRPKPSPVARLTPMHGQEDGETGAEARRRKASNRIPQAGPSAGPSVAPPLKPRLPKFPVRPRLAQPAKPNGR